MKTALLFLFILVSILSFGQTNTKLPDELVKSIDLRIKEGRNSSIVIGIVDNNGTHYFAFGNKSINGSPADEHTIYEIGSITKVFTATLLAQQVLDGKLKLDDPVKKFLPDSIKFPSRNNVEITLGNLSDHTSSLPRMPTNFAPKNQENPYADYTVAQLYAFLSGYTLPRDIGSAYEYSNLAQGLLGHILALNAGMPYEKLMIKTIAKPLGMKETKITFDSKMKKNLAIGYNQGKEVENWDIPTLAGAGAIRSSTFDMLKFLSANMGIMKSKLLPAMNMTHQVRHNKAGDMRVGLGWIIAKGKNGDVIWHNGGTGGYRTFAGFVKETGTGVVVMTNSTTGADDIGFYLLNPDSKLQFTKPGFAFLLRKTIDDKGVKEAWAVYHDITENKKADYDFNEANINMLGYAYIEKNIDAALAIFKMNIELFPNSWNVYDSYGQALLKNGQKDSAIVYYKKSIQMNPGNTNGIKILKDIGIDYQIENFIVPESILDTYLGSYELSPGFEIVITRQGNRLFGQATGQEIIELFAKSETEFYLKVVAAQIIFNLNEEKVVESLTLLQNGQEIKGKKIK